MKQSTGKFLGIGGAVILFLGQGCASRAVKNVSRDYIKYMEATKIYFSKKEVQQSYRDLFKSLDLARNEILQSRKNIEVRRLLLAEANKLLAERVEDPMLFHGGSLQAALQRGVDPILKPPAALLQTDPVNMRTTFESTYQKILEGSDKLVSNQKAVDEYLHNPWKGRSFTEILADLDLSINAARGVREAVENVETERLKAKAAIPGGP